MQDVIKKAGKMAEGLGEELLVDGDDLLSDDSSFYGPPLNINLSRP